MAEYASGEERLIVADYVSGGEKCGAIAPNGASVCALTKGHDRGHRNVYSTAEWPTSGRCTSIYEPTGERCAFADGAAHHSHRTATGLGYVHQDQWRPVQSAVTDLSTAAKVKVWHIGGPGMQPCGNVGPFDGMTCIRPVGHSGYHEHPRAGLKMVWSDVTDESVAKQLAALQRKVRAQANQINKLEELRRAAVDKQPEYQALKRHLDSRVAELDRDRRSERERGDRFQEELRQALAKPPTPDPPGLVKRSNNRFYRLAGLLGVATAGETWDTLLQRVADLRTELEVERARANARKAELDKLNAPRVTGHDAVRMFMGPAAEYGTDPVASRVAELVKDQDSTNRVMHVLNERLSKLETGTVLRCESRHSVSRVVAVLNERLSKLETGAVSRCESRHGDQRCVMFVGHMGPHHAGPGAERWV